MLKEGPSFGTQRALALVLRYATKVKGTILKSLREFGTQSVGQRHASGLNSIHSI